MNTTLAGWPDSYSTSPQACLVPVGKDEGSVNQYLASSIYLLNKSSFSSLQYIYIYT